MKLRGEKNSPRNYTHTRVSEEKGAVNEPKENSMARAHKATGSLMETDMNLNQ
jgi:hypothetical protein